MGCKRKDKRVKEKRLRRKEMQDKGGVIKLIKEEQAVKYEKEEKRE